MQLSHTFMDICELTAISEEKNYETIINANEITNGRIYLINEICQNTRIRITSKAATLGNIDRRINMKGLPRCIFMGW